MGRQVRSVPGGNRARSAFLQGQQIGDDILDLLAALNAGKKLIIWGTLSICILTGLVGQLIEDEYEATVQLLPPISKIPLLNASITVLPTTWKFTHPEVPEYDPAAR